VDLDAAQAAGIRDPYGRANLLSYLESEGFTLAEMVEAERQGRLFALAGDAVIRSGPYRHTLRTAAETLEQPFEDVVHAWSALGLTVSEPDQLALSDADIEALQTWVDIREALGEETSAGLLRVLGASMARLAEAESAAIRGTVPDVQLNYTADEVRTAKAFAAMGQLVPRLGRVMDAVHRQHLQSARTYFEQVVHDASSEVLVGVGFADLSGFTALTERLTLGELSGVLTTFGSTASDVVHAHDGRVVKLLGDAVMWVNVDANHLAEVALRLVEHPAAAHAGIQVRAGLAYGPVLALDGDYFGSAVNLAARLVAHAEPGQILAAHQVTDQLTGWSSLPLEPVNLRGFDEPVVPHSIRPTSS
jgi:class 3 adenylate cyclase